MGVHHLDMRVVRGVIWTSSRLLGFRYALIACLSPVMAVTIALGQFGALVGSVVLLAVSKEGWKQGLLLGLAATVKPQLLIAAPLILLVRRDWITLASAFLSGMLVILLELSVFRWQLWPEWLRALSAFPHALQSANAYFGSSSPAAFAKYLHLWPTPFLVLGALVAAFLIKARARNAGPVELAGLIIFSSSLMSPYLLVYDLPALLPLVLTTMFAEERRSRTAAIAVFFAPFGVVSLVWLAIAEASLGARAVRNGHRRDRAMEYAA